jgi:hypothetical protein
MARGGIIIVRRSILLIFVGWIPPDLGSSRSCFALGSGMIAETMANNADEDSPHH